MLPTIVQAKWDHKSKTQGTKYGKSFEFLFAILTNNTFFRTQVVLLRTKYLITYSLYTLGMYHKKDHRSNWRKDWLAEKHIVAFTERKACTE